MPIADIPPASSSIYSSVILDQTSIYFEFVKFLLFSVIQINFRLVIHDYASCSQKNAPIFEYFATDAMSEVEWKIILALSV